MTSPRRKSPLLLAFLATALSTALSAQSLPRVLILDFENKSGKATRALGIVAPLGVRFGYRITPDIALLAGLGAQGRFFQNSQGFAGYFSLGAGYDF